MYYCCMIHISQGHTRVLLSHVIVHMYASSVEQKKRLSCQDVSSPFVVVCGCLLMLVYQCTALQYATWGSSHRLCMQTYCSLCVPQQSGQLSYMRMSAKFIIYEGGHLNPLWRWLYSSLNAR